MMQPQPEPEPAMYQPHPEPDPGAGALYGADARERERQARMMQPQPEPEPGQGGGGGNYPQPEPEPEPEPLPPRPQPIPEPMPEPEPEMGFGYPHPGFGNVARNLAHLRAAPMMQPRPEPEPAMYQPMPEPEPEPTMYQPMPEPEQDVRNLADLAHIRFVRGGPDMTEQNIIIMKAAVRRGANPNNANQFSEDGWPPLCIAVRNNNVRMVKYLLEAGAEIGVACAETGRNAMHTAAFGWASWQIHGSHNRRTPADGLASQHEIVRILLQHDGDGLWVNSHDNRQMTPLHIVAGIQMNSDARDIARQLLEAGADPLQRDDQGRLAIDIADLVRNEAYEVIREDWHGLIMAPEPEMQLPQPEPEP